MRRIFIFGIGFYFSIGFSVSIFWVRFFGVSFLVFQCQIFFWVRFFDVGYYFGFVFVRLFLCWVRVFSVRYDFSVSVFILRTVLSDFLVYFRYGFYFWV